MQISDQEVRALVRAAIGRVGQAAAASDRTPSTSFERTHPSHGRLPVMSGSDGDGACLIEPTVRCNHCGYCQSFGH